MSGLVAVAIDGPAGSGKGTLARKLAGKLGYTYVDTGAFYRSLAWLAREHGVEPHEVSRLAELARGLQLRFERAPDGLHVFVGPVDVTGQIRSPEVGQLASAIAVHADVRSALLERQRAFAQAGPVVMDGRDIGSVVLPDAALKIFLVCDEAERARRRWQEHTARGEVLTYEAVKQAIHERDRQDAGRAVAPLKPATDAWVLDSTHLDPDTLVAQVCERVKTLGLPVIDLVSLESSG